MQRISAQAASEKWGISLRRVQDLCRQGRIPGAERFGKNWMVPADAGRPADGRRKEYREAKAEFVPMPRRSPMLSMTDLYQTPGTADRVSRSLRGNPLAMELFDAGIAYSRGEIGRVYDYAQDFLSNHTGFYAVTGAGFLLALCAIWRGDLQMWNEAKHHIASAPCRSDTDRKFCPWCWQRRTARCLNTGASRNGLNGGALTICHRSHTLWRRCIMPDYYIWWLTVLPQKPTRWMVFRG